MFQTEQVLREKALFVQEYLQKLYPNITCFLDHKDPFTLLVAVVLSAQATDKVVNKVTPQLFELAPTPEKLRELPESTIRKIIGPIGLGARKTKALKLLAEKLCEEYNGIVPQTFEELEGLPGVGHKTASVVMSQAFGKPAFPVDTHIQRLACRWGFGNEKSIRITEENLKTYFPQELWLRLHLQMIQYGRDYCPAQRHVVSDCAICSWKPRLGKNTVLKKTQKAGSNKDRKVSMKIKKENKMNMEIRSQLRYSLRNRSETKLHSE